MSELIVHLSHENLERLQAKAEDLNTSVESIVSGLVEQYLDDEDDDDNTPEEDLIELYPECVVDGRFDYEKYKTYILDGLREALIDIREGRTRPADEVFAELREELGLDGDES